MSFLLDTQANSRNKKSFAPSRFCLNVLPLALACDFTCYSTGTHHIVDVNYFPSFKGVPSAHAALCGLLSRKLGDLQLGVGFGGSGEM